MTFLTIFTMLIVFLRVFYVIYVKMSFHVIVPLKEQLSFKFKKLQEPKSRDQLDHLGRGSLSYLWLNKNVLHTLLGGYGGASYYEH